MKRLKTLIVTVAALGCIGCNVKNSIENTVNDATQLANLKNVEISIAKQPIDPFTITLHHPEILTGKTFEQMKALDSVKYCNPSNYGATFDVNLIADNSAANAGDAKFDGMTIDIGVDTLGAEPISTKASGFSIPKGATQKVTPTGTMNLLTHRVAGLYIFSKFAKGDTLVTTEKGSIAYKIGATQGSLPIILPDAKIPTRADPETRKFLSEAIGSGIFDKQN